MERRNILTNRLILRPFNLSDAEKVVALCNNYNVAKSTLYMPFPYSLEDAIAWINRHNDWLGKDERYEFAITDKVTGELFGGVTFFCGREGRVGGLGYWIGECFWNNGYATEAVKAIIDFVFNEKSYHKVHIQHFESNIASGKVARKCEMEYEGTLKDHIYKNGKYESVVCYGLINKRSVDT